MEITELVARLAEFLGPLWPVVLPILLKGGEEAWKAFAKVYGEKFGKESLELTQVFWRKLFDRIKGKPAALEAAKDAADAQDDADTQASVRQQLKKILSEEPELVKEGELIIGQVIDLSYSERSVSGRDFIDSPVITGDKNRYVKADVYIEGNVYTGPPLRDPQEALNVYRRVVAQANSSLPLRGVDLGASDPTAAQKPIGLANVYVDLDTTTQIEIKVQDAKEKRRALSGEEEKKPLSALQAVIRNRRLVLKGDPGSGKSTFVNYLAYCLASKKIAGLEGWPKTEPDILPLSVILRDFARSLPRTLPRQADPCHLWNFITTRLKAQNLFAAAKPIEQLLELGKVLLMLDGLDEVPTVEQRVFIRDAVHAFAIRYPENRFLVTCRVLSYQPPKSNREPDLRLAAFPEFELTPFDGEKISSFIKHWYDELAGLAIVLPEEAPRLTQRLQEAIQRPELRRLAPNPLLLTVMALVHTHKGRLPDARALLYEDTIEILLWRWEQVSKGQASLSNLMLEAGCTDIDLKRVLQELAFQAHEQTQAEDDDETLAGISESSLENALAKLNKGDRNWAAQVIETMKMRAGLLLERDVGVFTFPHRSFQEYLAGAHLTSREDFVTIAIKLADSRQIWREVILWAVGCFVYLPGGNIHMPLALASELCSSAYPKSNHDWAKTWLAGDILLEIGTNRAGATSVGHDLLPRVSERLSNLLAEGALTPRERAAAGDTLSRLGDPRFDEKAWYLPVELLRGFVHIPAGKFIMGTKAEDVDGLVKKYRGSKEWFESEIHQHEPELEDYYLARYPVTVAQFRAFVEEEKYRPADPNSLEGLPSQPVRYVTWFDAIAYCTWLDGKLKNLAKACKGKDPQEVAFWRGLTEGKLQVILPSEAEWEKAARGTDGREFPWEGEFDSDKANVEMNIGRASVVGCFPDGKSPYGLLDMSGNVWEWTRSIYAKYPYDPTDGRENLEAGRDTPRVLRGGALYHYDWFSRCAYRRRDDPHYGWLATGFRVVVVASPILGS